MNWKKKSGAENLRRTKQKPKILIAESDDFSPDVIKHLQTFAQVDMRSCKQKELSTILKEYDVFWFRLGFKIDEAVLSSDSRCKILATPVTGIDHIDEKLCEDLGISIACLRGEREFLREVRATAEMTIGLAMSVMRHIPVATDSVTQGNWERDRFRGNELYRKTIGIIGYGRLGAIVAEYAKAFGMKVIAIEPREDVRAITKEVVFFNDLEELARCADVISLHINYNGKTHHLIDEAFFRACKRTSFFINTSRGGIVEEKALLKALENKWIAGAALDVLQNEPKINLENPLVAYAKENNNLIIVPHIGGNTYESFEKTEKFIAQKVKSILKVKEMI